MKVIGSNAELGRQLKRLIKTYPRISIATAWASADTDVFDALVRHEDRIVRTVVGTHFYQTHPDVLDQFVDSTSVKFILQPDGVFHPKVYLFWSPDAWEVIIGSPNMTVGALSKNSELSVLITSNDGHPELKREIGAVIRGYWEQASTVSLVEAGNYRRLWRLKTRDLKKVADLFGDKLATKPAVQSKVMSMDWPSYLADVKKDKTHGFKKRLELIEVIRQHFHEHKRFNDMPLDVRKGIAGLPNKAIEYWGWFGSMKGAMTFGGLVNKGNKALSLALDQIPLTGQVSKGSSPLGAVNS